MSYLREIPRDLFNEANLLKCLGQVYLRLEDLGKEAKLIHIAERDRFHVLQDASDGGLWVANVYLRHRLRSWVMKRPLNSRHAWPLYVHEAGPDEEDLQVFDDMGMFTEEMIAWLNQ
jgi:hypothetical protein